MNDIIKQDEFLSNALSVDAIVGQQKMLKDVMAKVMKKDIHYGIVPGCQKPSLWKPGAELLCMTFRLSPAFMSQNIFDGKHLTVTSSCTLTHIPSGKVFGGAEAMCSTKEKKYRLRKEGGKIVENANLEDQYNTVLKMANKRALIAAMLIVTGSSDLLTQDMGEDDEPLVAVDVDVTVQDAPKQPETPLGSTQTPNKAIQADPKPSEASKAKSERWDGVLSSVQEQVLSDGSPCWEIIGEGGIIFKTADKKCSDLADEAGSNKVQIKFKANGKGTKVIQSLKVEAL